MPRLAKLRKKNGFWYTAAGAGAYFGRVGVVTYQDAKTLFAAHLKGTGTRQGFPRDGIATAVLVDLYLEWLQTHRSDRSYDERKRHLDRFVDFIAPGSTGRIAELSATAIRADDLTALLAYVGKLESNQGGGGKKKLACWSCRWVCDKIWNPREIKGFRVLCSGTKTPHGVRPLQELVERRDGPGSALRRNALRSTAHCCHNPLMES